MDNSELPIGTHITVNSAGAQRHPSLADRTGIIRVRLRYTDGTVEYVVDFDTPGGWDWLCSHEVDVIENEAVQ